MLFTELACEKRYEQHSKKIKLSKNIIIKNDYKDVVIDDKTHSLTGAEENDDFKTTLKDDNKFEKDYEYINQYNIIFPDKNKIKEIFLFRKLLSLSILEYICGENIIPIKTNYNFQNRLDDKNDKLINDNDSHPRNTQISFLTGLINMKEIKNANNNNNNNMFIDSSELYHMDYSHPLFIHPALILMVRTRVVQTIFYNCGISHVGVLRYCVSLAVSILQTFKFRFEFFFFFFFLFMCLFYLFLYSFICVFMYVFIYLFSFFFFCFYLLLFSFHLGF
jgi:hypothetical protein